MTEGLEGKCATLITPWRGYTRITIVEPAYPRWLCRIAGSGYEIDFYEDEFIIDD
jgi:hypothetical protein